MSHLRQGYTREFKMRAVQLAGQAGVGPTAAAKQLGIHPTLIYRWRKHLAAEGPDQAFPGHGKRSGLEGEVDRLRRENAQLMMERDILKKAAQYFAREHP